MIKDDVVMAFKTSSPIIASFIMFILIYGFFSFLSDTIDFIVRHYFR